MHAGTGQGSQPLQPRQITWVAPGAISHGCKTWAAGQSPACCNWTGEQHLGNGARPQEADGPSASPQSRAQAVSDRSINTHTNTPTPIRVSHGSSGRGPWHPSSYTLLPGGFGQTNKHGLSQSVTMLYQKMTCKTALQEARGRRKQLRNGLKSR